MPAVPSINVLPALAIVLAIAAVIGVLFGLLEARLDRRDQRAGAVHELPTVVDEPGDVRRSA